MAHSHSGDRRRRIDPDLNPHPEDRISSLPDKFLLSTLSRLSLKEAVSTSILARRWRYLWRTIPSISLSFSPGLCSHPDPWYYSSAVDTCLSTCASCPSISSMSFHVFYEFEKSIYLPWIDFAVAKSIRSLTIIFDYINLDEEYDLDLTDDSCQLKRSIKRFIEPPIELFSVSTLAFLKLEQCKLPVLPAKLGKNPCFPNLETAAFQDIVLNSKNLSGLISTSTRLKNLKIAGVRCKAQIVISCPSLETLDIYKSLMDVNCSIKIVEVPKLRVLSLCCDLEKVDLTGLVDCIELDEVTMFCNPRRNFQTRDAWAKLVSCISGTKTLRVDYWFLQHKLRSGEDSGSGIPMFSNLRLLEICGGPFAHKWFPRIVDLLRESPCLEKLVLQDNFNGANYSNSEDGDKNHVPKDFDFESDDIIQEFKNSKDIARNLKTIEIFAHNGHMNVIKLMYFISSHAYNLEKVDICTETKIRDRSGAKRGFYRMLEFKWVSSLVKFNIVEGPCGQFYLGRWMCDI